MSANLSISSTWRPFPVWSPHEGQQARETPSLEFTITAHIRGLGDKKCGDDGWVGSASDGRELEGFAIACNAAGWSDYITYQSICGDRSMSAKVVGNSYCGTRGKMIPLHGFVVHVAAEAANFGNIRYEGMFLDNYSTGLLRPGSLCVSPIHAPLVAMRIISGSDSTKDAPTTPSSSVATRSFGTNIPKHQGGVALNDVDSTIWDEEPLDVSLVVHVATIGDTPAREDGWGGSPIGDRVIEGFSATHALPEWSSDLVYRAVLSDGSLGPPIRGGLYCGTRGSAQPLHGFLLELPNGKSSLPSIIYEGLFQDKFRSSVLSPGQICASPNNAALLAMRIAISGAEIALAPAIENIRLVIWDLDETFWSGTLTEGGITWSDENEQIVRELASRGIISSICSKNNHDEVYEVLKQHAMQDYFVFSSISWDTKGPRLASIIDAMQLRASTAVFIDDNPLNRAEAEQFVPGLNVWDEHCLATLLRHPRLQGKNDAKLTRLDQYKVLQRRHIDHAGVQGNTSQFLRESNIKVYIEHDIEPHIDRAVELINRTNQLNFTKARLPDHPDDPELARITLRAQLSPFNVQAGLLHVRDRYGDYGYCGFYALRRDMSGEGVLLHFAFSCRILGMNIETWLYRHLNRPRLMIAGQVLTNIYDESLVVDWISSKSYASQIASRDQPRPLRYVLARGACDMRALSHYFINVADIVIEELQVARAGQNTQPGHSLIASQALRGMPAEAVKDFAPLGFLPEDFHTSLGKLPPDGPAVWLFGFNLECQTPIFQHIETGAFLPANINGLDVTALAMMNGAAAGHADPEVIAHMRQKFVLFGQRPDPKIDELFRDSLQLIFSQAKAQVSIFVLLSNTHTLNSNGSVGIIGHCLRHNDVISEVARRFPNVELLAPQDFMTVEELAGLTNAHHFDRIVYFRVFTHIMQRIEARAKAEMSTIEEVNALASE